MKHIRLTIALFAALLTAGTLTTASDAVAQSTSVRNSVHVARSAVKKIRVKTPVGVSTDVSVIDQTGTIMYSGTVKAKDARGTSLNLVNLPDGRYFVTVTNNDVWVSQGITVRNDQVSVDAQNVTELVRPALIAYEANKYEVKMPGVRELTVAIYDRMNDLVFTKSYGSTGEIHRFDLSSLPSGDYTFVYGPQQKQFTEHVAIK